MISNDDLLKWIDGMPLWFRKATELYYKNGIISDEDISFLADSCFRDEPFSVENINLINHGKKAEFAIMSISDVQGVNAICSDKPLTFNPTGLSIVYGCNGSGKSGYIRILKMISGAKYREEIKNNIYSSKTIHPKACISITDSEGGICSYDCDLQIPGEYESLSTIDIFDTKVSNAYMKEAKEATYEPWVFEYFAYMADVANRIKVELETRKQQCHEIPYSFPENLKESSSFRKLQSITYKTKAEEFPSEWTEIDEEDLKRKKSNNNRETLLIKKERIKDKQKNTDLLESYFVKFISFFSDESWERIQKEQNKLRLTIKLREDSEKLFSQNASEIDAESINNASWKSMWKYARQYYDEIIKPEKNDKFAQLGSICPLCGQILTDCECVVRMESIDSYINGKVIEDEEQERTTYNSLLNVFPTLKNEDELSSLIELAGLGNKKSELLKQNQILQDYCSVVHDEKQNLNINKYDTSILKNILSEHKDYLVYEGDAINELLTSDKQKQLEIEICELEATKHLTTQHTTIRNNIDILNKIHTIEKAERLLATNKITTKSKELATQIITEDYINRFKKELRNLTKNSLEVELKPQRAGKGRIPYKVVLVDSSGKSVSPQDILSEGENRVASLAAFFAESEGRQENVPLVFDDPISSLDYNYEQLVVDRLIEAASKRQVIVFTHRISLVVELQDVAKKNGVKCDEISLLFNKYKKGVPSKTSDITGSAKSQLNNLINDDLAKLKKLQLEDEFSSNYRKAFHNVCHEFRNIVEKSIEEDLIGGVVKRFQRDIKTKDCLHKLSEITKEDCDMYDCLMTRYSYYDHSMADETPLIEISIEDLENDMLTLKTWIKERKKATASS